MTTFNSTTNEKLVEMLKSVFNQYKECFETMKDFPDWQEKIKVEIGGIWGMIYAQHKSNQQLEDLFNKADFDRYFYFK